MSAARRVAIGSIREVLGHLRALQDHVNATGPPISRRVALLLVGHSIGGLILYSAVSEYLVEAATNNQIVREHALLVVDFIRQLCTDRLRHIAGDPRGEVVAREVSY
jgi:hypothetical protein